MFGMVLQMELCRAAAKIKRAVIIQKHLSSEIKTSVIIQKGIIQSFHRSAGKNILLNIHKKMFLKIRFSF